MKTREQMELETKTARNCNIFLIAEHFGYTFKNNVGNQECINQHGLVIFGGTNSFYDYYRQRGGSPIDFVMYEKDCDTRTAIDYICSLSNVRFEAEKNFVHNKVEKKFQKKNGDLVLPEANTDHKRVFAYLRYTRNISQDVVQYALKNRLVYESKERHNAVFIGYSRNMEVKHAFLRGTITGVQFRGDVSGSDKAYGFSIEGDKSRVVVFEAPIDLLSYRTMYPNDKSNLLALGMVADMPLDKYLEEYPEIKNISLALDNDRAGFDASLDIKRKYKEKGYEVEDNRVVDELQKNNVKDVNELLCILPEFKELRKSKSR